VGHCDAIAPEQIFEAMKRFLLGFVAGSVCSVAVWMGGIHLLAKAGPSERAQRLFTEIPQQAAGGELQVALGGAHGYDVEFTRGSESFRYTPPKGEFCKYPVCTPDGRTAFVLVEAMRNQGYTYGCILRFDFGDAELSAVQPQRILPLKQLEALFGGRSSWVNDMHKVSADGNQLLLNISSAAPAPAVPGTSSSAVYFENRPCWYDIKSNTLKEPPAP
jgi:hypothetical protein